MANVDRLSVAKNDFAMTRQIPDFVRSTKSHFQLKNIDGNRQAGVVVVDVVGALGEADLVRLCRRLQDPRNAKQDSLSGRPKPAAVVILKL